MSTVSQGRARVDFMRISCIEKTQSVLTNVLSACGVYSSVYDIGTSVPQCHESRMPDLMSIVFV